MSHVTCHTCVCHWPTQVKLPVGHVTWRGRAAWGEIEKQVDGEKKTFGRKLHVMVGHKTTDNIVPWTSQLID